MNEMKNNFDMQQLMNIVGQQGMNVNTLIEHFGSVKRKVETLEEKTNAMENELKNFIGSVYVSGRERRILHGVAAERVYSLLGVPKKNRSDKDREIVQKYSSLFFARLYSDARRESKLGDLIDETLKTDFEDVLKYFKTWTPACGVDGLIREADENARWRRIANDEGF